ncbi:LOW QUALITY PROTEIN: olfactory receptor 5A2-like [Discoglossus pictus]
MERMEDSRADLRSTMEGMEDTLDAHLPTLTRRAGADEAACLEQYSSQRYIPDRQEISSSLAKEGQCGESHLSSHFTVFFIYRQNVKMKIENHTTIKEFILVGLTEHSEIHLLLFVLFLFIYIICLIGNFCIIITYKFSPSLHTPMYFHLSNFSFLEICYVSSTIPKMLSNLLSDKKTISFYGCAVQMFLFLLLGSTECYMLAAMAYDRYNAICHPLLYNFIMDRRMCIQLITGSYVIGAVNALVHTALTFTSPFCGSTQINHFFCDIPPLLKLLCSDTWINEIIIFFISGAVIVGSFLLTMISYTQIVSTIINIRTASGKKKAFSTCASHFIVVTIFYGSGIFMYMKSSYSMNQDRIIAVMYAVIAPLLNPFIYSLRNSEVKIAFKKAYRRRFWELNKQEKDSHAEWAYRLQRAAM